MIAKLFISIGSFVAALNLAVLFPSPDYHAAWWKAGLAAALVLLGFVLSQKTTK